MEVSGQLDVNVCMSLVIGLEVCKEEVDRSRGFE